MKKDRNRPKRASAPEPVQSGTDSAPAEKPADPAPARSSKVRNLTNTLFSAFKSAARQRAGQEDRLDTHPNGLGNVATES